MYIHELVNDNFLKCQEYSCSNRYTALEKLTDSSKCECIQMYSVYVCMSTREQENKGKEKER